MRVAGGGCASLDILLLCLIASLTGGCNLLPPQENRSASVALDDTGTTRLGKAISPRIAANPGHSGVHLLANAHAAFAARVLLVRAAERSLDVQYYIWKQDVTGALLFQELFDAAERGVRVRLLLDDNNTAGLDQILAVLHSHPNIEVRLFNPLAIRGLRALNYLIDFSRLNRRMHNKSFTADNQATIIGGRNVGDEYFGAADDVLFADLDVLAVGPVVNDVSNDFDRYWASESSYPVDRLLPPADPGMLSKFSSTIAKIRQGSAATDYIGALRDSSSVQELLEGNLTLEWVTTRMVSDDPAKGLGQASPDALLTYTLKEIIGDPAVEIDLISPYFVPTAAGVESFTALAGEGVKIKVLTNSLEATDVAAVHAGYAKRREPLLAAGITLYETQRLRRSARQPEGSGFTGSSDSSLHAKTFSVDGSRIFVGSFNFDPRSAHLNTEMGFVIDSPKLATQIAAAFHRTIPVNAYEVRLSRNDELYWIEQRGEKQLRHDTEPGTSFWQRLGVRILAMLPIEWML
jgi:cardiolipin synthase C